MTVNFLTYQGGASNKELAQRLNISKMAINVEIRRAVNKIVNKIIL
ncbi:helix-turn-helix domain-containing protein [Acidiplasma cupricumulans]|nr:helix-turn-helix domain-containing protein [Acidiplasma cupricumulans]